MAAAKQPAKKPAAKPKPKAPAKPKPPVLAVVNDVVVMSPLTLQSEVENAL